MDPLLPRGNLPEWPPATSPLSLSRPNTQELTPSPGLHFLPGSVGLISLKLSYHQSPLESADVFLLGPAGPLCSFAADHFLLLEALFSRGFCGILSPCLPLTPLTAPSPSLLATLHGPVNISDSWGSAPGPHFFLLYKLPPGRLSPPLPVPARNTLTSVLSNCLLNGQRPLAQELVLWWGRWNYTHRDRRVTPGTNQAVRKDIRARRWRIYSSNSTSIY